MVSGQILDTMFYWETKGRPVLSLPAVPPNHRHLEMAGERCLGLIRSLVGCVDLTTEIWLYKLPNQTSNLMVKSLGFQSSSRRKLKVSRLGDRRRVLKQLFKNIIWWRNEGPVWGVKGVEWEVVGDLGYIPVRISPPHSCHYWDCNSEEDGSSLGGKPPSIRREFSALWCDEFSKICCQVEKSKMLNNVSSRGGNRTYGCLAQCEEPTITPYTRYLLEEGREGRRESFHWKNILMALGFQVTWDSLPS